MHKPKIKTGALGIFIFLISLAPVFWGCAAAPATAAAPTPDLNAVATHTVATVYAAVTQAAPTLTATTTPIGVLTPTPPVADVPGMPSECLNRDPAVPTDLYQWLGYGPLGCKLFSYSLDGKYLAYANLVRAADGKNNTELIKLVDLETQASRVIYRPQAVKYWIRELSWDGRNLLNFQYASVNNLGPKLVYDPQTDAVTSIPASPTPTPELSLLIQSVQSAQPASATHLAWSPDSKFIAAAAPGQLQLFDAEGLSTKWQVSFKGVVDWLDYSPDGAKIAVLVKNGIQGTDEYGIIQADKTEILLFNASDGSLARRWEVGSAMMLRFEPSGRQIATAGGDIVFWETATGVEKWRLRPDEIAGLPGPVKLAAPLPFPRLGGCGGVESINFVTFSKKQPLMIAAGMGGTCGFLLAWDWKAHQLKRQAVLTFPGSGFGLVYGYEIMALGFDEQAGVAITITKNGTIDKWDVTGEETSEFNLEAGMGADAESIGAALSARSDLLAWWGVFHSESDFYPLFLDSTRDGLPQLAIFHEGTDPADQTLAAAFSPDDRLLASADLGGRLHLWRVAKTGP